MSTWCFNMQPLKRKDISDNMVASANKKQKTNHVVMASTKTVYIQTDFSHISRYEVKVELLENVQENKAVKDHEQVDENKEVVECEQPNVNETVLVQEQVDGYEENEATIIVSKKRSFTEVEAQEDGNDANSKKNKTRHEIELEEKQKEKEKGKESPLTVPKPESSSLSTSESLQSSQSYESLQASESSQSYESLQSSQPYESLQSSQSSESLQSSESPSEERKLALTIFGENILLKLDDEQIKIIESIIKKIFLPMEIINDIKIIKNKREGNEDDATLLNSILNSITNTEAVNDLDRSPCKYSEIKHSIYQMLKDKMPSEASTSTSSAPIFTCFSPPPSSPSSLPSPPSPAETTSPASPAGSVISASSPTLTASSPTLTAPAPVRSLTSFSPSSSNMENLFPPLSSPLPNALLIDIGDVCEPTNEHQQEWENLGSEEIFLQTELNNLNEDLEKIRKRKEELRQLME
ncbi:unnamed protein product [Cunninghamella blakesleeana]